MTRKALLGLFSLFACAALGQELDYHGPGRVACDREFTESGKPDSDYGPFITDCLHRRGVAAVPNVRSAPNDETFNSPVPATKAQREFLEAATYFITAVDVDPSRGDIVSGTQVELGRYPIVVYLDDTDECVVRVRTTTVPYTVWQFNFCKIRYWRTKTDSYYTTMWFGEYDAFCVFRGWDKNENYSGYVGPNNSQCGHGSKSTTTEVWYSGADINTLVNVTGKPRNPFYSSSRPVNRMIDSFKYIEALLTGKPY